MEANELLDEPARQPRRKFNKNPLLYGMATLFLAGFFFKQNHWPGAAILILFGGGLSVGYIAGLLVYFKQHFFFEIAGMFLYASFITFIILRDFNLYGWICFAGMAVVVFIITTFLLREKEIT